MYIYWHYIMTAIYPMYHHSDYMATDIQHLEHIMCKNSADYFIWSLGLGITIVKAKIKCLFVF